MPRFCSDSGRVEPASKVRRWEWLGELCSLERDRDGCSLTEVAVQRDLSIVVVDRVLNNRQAQPGSTRLFRMALIDAVESLKNTLLLFGGNADSLVANIELNRL